MDGAEFDRLVKSLSATGSRRGALGSLLAGTLGLLGLTETTASHHMHRPTRKHPHREPKRENRPQGQHETKKRRKASAEGPCGNGGAKANACTRDAQCCTGYCEKKKGRCRCRGLGQSCNEDRNCCATLGQPTACQNGACQTICSPPCPECHTCRDGVCVLSPGQPCGSASCVAGSATPQGTCTATGACQPAMPVSCAPYLLCAGNVCAASCGSTAECVPDSYCSADHRCLSTQPIGTSCTAGEQCQSGHCADGVCCDTACLDECTSCNVSGSVGTCGASPIGTLCTSVVCGTCDASSACVNDPDSTNCCDTGLRCKDGACIAAYATIPECGGRCNCPASVLECTVPDTSQFGPPACSSSGELRCSDCDSGCVAETNCDDGEFTRIPNGPEGTSYYCTCTLAPPCPPPDQPCGTCPPGTEEFCREGVCWNICDDP